MSDNEVGAAVVHVVVVLDDRSAKLVRRERREPLECGVRGVRVLRARRRPTPCQWRPHLDAQGIGGEDAVACGGDLAGEGASQSALCSEKIYRMVSGSLTVYRIHRRYLIHS
jgi:hypothetical protein